MKSTPQDCDRDVAELMRVMQKGVSKHGVRKVTDKIKEIDIEDSNENYIEVRDFIIDCVCSLFNVKKEEVINKGKRGMVTTARKVAIVVIKTHFNISDDDLGRYFNGRTRQVIYKVMREYECMDRNDKLDHKNFFKHFDAVNEKTIAFMKPVNKEG